MTERIDYARVVADLETKKGRMVAEFDAAIRAIRQIVAMEGLGSVQTSLFSVSGANAINAAAALQKPSVTGTMVDVAITHLRSVGGGPVPNMELARALDAGGFPHKSKNFPNTLNSILHRRSKTVGDVHKVNKGWEIVRKKGEAAVGD